MWNDLEFLAFSLSSLVQSSKLSCSSRSHADTRIKPTPSGGKESFHVFLGKHGVKMRCQSPMFRLLVILLPRSRSEMHRSPDGAHRSRPRRVPHSDESPRPPQLFVRIASVSSSLRVCHCAVGDLLSTSIIDFAPRFWDKPPHHKLLPLSPTLRASNYRKLLA
jgi:hypothetical protein